MIINNLNKNNENFYNEFMKGNVMDVIFSSCFFKFLVLGCGVYVVRELCVKFVVKLWNKEENGYERLLF